VPSAPKRKQRMTQVYRPDEEAFLQALSPAAGVSIDAGDQLFMYFFATDGTGVAECFTRRGDGRVAMVDPQREMFDLLYSDWQSCRRNADRAWTWGWAIYGASGEKPVLHLQNEVLSDEQIAGTKHALEWRRSMFGTTQIENPSFG
jgi:hypothetical protein